MFLSFEIEKLSQQDVARSFAVIQPVLPTLDLETWKGFMNAGEQRRHWAAAKDQRGYIHAIAKMVPVKHPLLGDLLEVPFFRTVSLLEEDDIGSHLMELARRVAQKERCEAIRFWTNHQSLLHLIELPPEASDGSGCTIVRTHGSRTLH